MSVALQAIHPEEYEACVHLIEHGVPIFIATPADTFPDGGSAGGYDLPVRWQETQPDVGILQDWQPGDALCAVMGHAVDGLDIDTNKGGYLPPDLTPESYGKARTPSGGTHDLIAPLRARSRDGLLPGVDYKGGAAGLGHGFLFLAPTAKRSKVTGEIGRYEWIESPDLELLDLLGDDQSGSALAVQINQGRVSTEDGRPEYDGPSYPDLPPERQEQADRYLDDTIFDWKVRLGSASGWPEGETDHQGRGWEALSRDAAWAIARIAVCPWTELAEDRAQDLYDDILPDVMARDPKCRGKWYDGILEKAAAQPAAQPPWWLDVVFEQSPILATIEQAAISGYRTPEGLLGVILGRILAEVPPHVMLPPVNGAPASLNLGIAMVAKSGGGKSSAVISSRHLIGEVGLNQTGIEEGTGSGEGLIDMFLEEVYEENAKGELKKTGRFTTKPDPRVVYVVDEVDSLAAAGDRSGSTLNANMRTALTGGSLKTSNSRAGGRYRAVEGGSYRLVVLVGVQPMASGVLLSQHEESRGTPQRFLWVKMTDKKAVFPDPLPQWPESLDWEPPTLWPDGYIEYPDHIRETIVEFQRRLVREEADGNEGHAMLTRLKVAFGLAVLHGESKISDQWWSLSGMLMERSKQVQAECKSALSVARQEQVYHSVLGQKKAEVMANEVVTEDRLVKAAQAVVQRLQKDPGTEFQWSKIKPNSRLLGKGPERLATPDIIEEVVRAGVEVREDGNSILLRWVEE